MPHMSTTSTWRNTVKGGSTVPLKFEEPSRALN